MFTEKSKTFEYGGVQYTLSTGKVARQASAAVQVTSGNLSVLVTVVAQTEPSDRDFFPLTVNYQEKAYAVGKIPGGYLKREGRPSEKETLTCRLIDRPIRPLFPNGFKHEVQVVATVMSSDKETDPDIAALIGASAALTLSGVPFAGPIGAARVAYIDGLYVLNPTYAQLEQSELDLVVAGTESAVLMVESEAKELTEDEMLGGVIFGHEEMQTVIRAINEFAAEAGKPKWDWQAPTENTELAQAVSAQAAEGIKAAYAITEKMKRYEQLSAVRAATVEALCANENDSEEAAAAKPSKGDVMGALGKLEKQTVRQSVINGQPRIDGRSGDQVRAIEVEVGVLPNAHGSALFTRGETQAIVAATLGSTRDAQMIDALEGTKHDAFMLHYNFPPYCVGETGMIGSPKRREIGHGRLARRGVQAMLPSQEQFPYTIRVVSEITESNGSSSMASVCGSSMAMMHAGVPLANPVAGIAMGLVKEGEQYAVLSDILGDEDHLGDMDFKVAGTEQGITALQMDIKIEGITEEIMEVALNQAKAGRLHILGEMAKAISETRTEMPDSAPAFATIKIDPDKIRDVIGKGGVTIRSICEDTGASVDIDDDGTVKIFGENKASAKAAYERVMELTAEPEIGVVYRGKVARVVDFGAFVNILPGTDGLVHISQITDTRVENVSDYLSEGQMVNVLVQDVDQRGRIKLTMIGVEQEAEAVS